jgi:hypothetical protein
MPRVKMSRADRNPLLAKMMIIRVGFTPFHWVKCFLSERLFFALFGSDIIGLTQTRFAHFHRVLLLSLLRIKNLSLSTIIVYHFIVDNYCLFFYYRPLLFILLLSTIIVYSFIVGHHCLSFYFLLLHRKAAFFLYIHFRWPCLCCFGQFLLHPSMQTDQKTNSYL